MAGLYFSVGADFQKLQQLKKDLDDLKSKLKGMDSAADKKAFEALNRQLQQAQREYDALAGKLSRYVAEQNRASQATSSSANEMLSLFAKIGGTTALISLGKQVMDVRNEFQQLEIAFGTMLKSTDKAASLMKDLTKFAAETPFGLQSAASGAKQLLAYGSTADTVIKELTMLGDVAAGTGQQIGDLVYLYGTLRTQGRAYLMDIRQFAGRGIPIYDELAKVLNTSKDKVNDLVSAGKVGFPEVEKAFKNMTAQGGLYGGLMEEQSKSIGGRMEALGDNISSIFNKIGKDSEGFIYGSIDGINALVENYETVGKILMGLVATYGVYRAALIVNAVATSGLTAAETAHYAALVLSDKAQKALNASMMKNPYVLMAAAVVALGYGVYKLATYETEAEKATKRLRDASVDLNTSIQSESATLGIMFDRLKKAKEGTSEYELAKKAIQDKYGSYLQNMSEEVRLLENTTLAYNELSIAIIKNARTKGFESFISESSTDSGKRQAEALQRLRERIIKEKKDTNIGDAIFTQIRDLMRGYDSADSDYNKIFSDIQKILKDNNLTVKEIGGYDITNQIGAYAKAAHDLRKATEGAKKIYGDPETKLEDDTDKTPKAIQDQIFSATKRVQELKNELKDLQKGIIPDASKNDAGFDFAKEIEEKTKSLKEAEDKLSFLLYGKSSSGYSKDTKTGETAAEKAIKLAQDQADKELEIYNNKIKSEFDLRSQELENEQTSLNNQQDSFDKQQKQNELNYKKETLALEKHIQEMVETAQKIERADWNLKNPKGSKTPFKTKINSLSNLSVPQQSSVIQTDSLNNDAFVKSTAETLKTLLGLYKDYNEKRKSINEEYDASYTALDGAYKNAKTDEEKARIDAAIAQLKKQWGEALSSVNLEEFQDKIDWSVVFGNLEKVSTNKLINLRDTIKENLSTLGKSLSPQDLKTVTDAVDKLDEKITEKKPIGEVENAYEAYKKAVDGVTAAKKELAKYEKGTAAYAKAAKELANAEDKRAEALNKMGANMQGAVNKAKDYYQAGQEIITTLDTMGVKMSEGTRQAVTGIGEIIDGADKMAEGLKNANPAKIIEGSIVQVRGYYNLITGIFGSHKQLSESTIRNYKNLMSVLDDVIAKQKELLATMSGDRASNQAKESIELLEKQIVATKELGKEYLNTYAKGQGHSRGWHANKNLSGFKKELEALGISWDKLNEKDYMEGFFDLTPEQLQNIKKNIPGFWAKLDDSTREYAENIIASGEAIVEMGDQLKEQLTGTTFDSLLNGLDDLVSKVDLVFSDIADSFEDHMSKAILEFVKNEIMQKELKQWYADFAEAMKGGLTEDEANDLQGRYVTIIDEANKKYKEAMDLAGLELDKGSSQTPSSGYSVSMDQETGDKLVGISTGSQMRLISIDQNVAKIAQWNQPISEKFNFDSIAIPLGALSQSSLRIERMIEENRNIAVQMFYVVKDIKGDTANLSAIKDGINSMNSKLDNL